MPIVPNVPIRRYVRAAQPTEIQNEVKIRAARASHTAVTSGGRHALACVTVPPWLARKRLNLRGFTVRAQSLGDCKPGDDHISTVIVF
jgi:hypothetical protein